MEFEWDDKKNTENILKHGIDFVDVIDIFNEPMFTRLDTRQDYGEDRWIGIGYVKSRILTVCFTERHERHSIRIISARRALSHERKAFEKEIANRLGEGR